MNNKLISVIMPIYNSETYLSDCIDSILKQSYQSFELILVDDGSTDQTHKICEKYVKIDDRVRYFYIDNSGVSVARNYGLDKAQGEYVSFVDSDDLLHPDYLSSLAWLIENESHDFANVGYSTDFNELGCIINKEYTSLQTQEIRNCILENSYIDGYLWNKLFKLRIINENNIRFAPEITIWEDMLFFIKYLYCCSSGAYSSNILYYYRQHAGSAITSMSEKKYVDKLHVCKEIMSISANRSDNLYKSCERIYANCLISYCSKLAQNKKNKSSVDDLKNEIATSGILKKSTLKDRKIYYKVLLKTMFWR